MLNGNHEEYIFLVEKITIFSIPCIRDFHLLLLLLVPPPCEEEDAPQHHQGNSKQSMFIKQRTPGILQTKETNNFLPQFTKIFNPDNSVFLG